MEILNIRHLKFHIVSKYKGCNKTYKNKKLYIENYIRQMIVNERFFNLDCTRRKENILL